MARQPESSVEVVYARPDAQQVVTLARRDGMTAADAVAASGLLQAFPEIAAQPLELGIFGQRVPHDRALIAGDRVEIYRPLPDDPKERRRRRAAEAAASKRRPGR